MQAGFGSAAMLGMSALRERRVDDRQHARRRMVELELELDEAPPRSRLLAAPAEDRDPVLHQARVRNHHGLVVVGGERHVAPADADDLAADVVDADPVADPAGALDLQREAAPQVAQRLLRREGDRAGDHRRRRRDAQQVDAERVQPEQPVTDQRQRDHELDHDPRRRDAREQHLEGEARRTRGSRRTPSRPAATSRRIVPSVGGLIAAWKRCSA